MNDFPQIMEWYRHAHSLDSISPTCNTMGEEMDGVCRWLLIWGKQKALSQSFKPSDEFCEMFEELHWVLREVQQLRYGVSTIHYCSAVIQKQ